jgi:hypothetical protein
MTTCMSKPSFLCNCSAILLLVDGYQTIMEWAAFAQEKDIGLVRVERVKSRKATLQRMIKRLDMECPKPFERQFHL